MTELEFEQHFESIHPKVHSYFFKRIEHRENAEDLTLLSLTKYFQNVKNPESSLHYGYLWTVARNTLIDFYRTNGKSDLSTSQDFEDHGDDYWDNYKSKNYQNRVESLLECLKNNSTEKEYLLVERIYLKEEQASKIAAQMNIAYSALRKRLSRLLEKLRDKCKALWLETK